MKLNFDNRMSQSLLLAGSIIASNITPVYANELADGQQVAMYKSALSISTPFENTKLSATKMLYMANSLDTPHMSKYQKELQFALIFSAANKGLAEAQFRLANYYLDSDMVEADDNEASYWLEEAMAQGHQDAKFIYVNLGVADFDIGC